ncbi:MAG TPA: 23S rRNA (adenine(2503)-C(2))-methyltransferase RlmN [Cryomorphaceae bacterium]|nr:23S rRNA (adenine(2503)-C(2))-methyltransferase RlmN [Cryomorphaceae bacterium]
MNNQVDIRKLSKDELIDLFKEMGEKPFRGKQVFEWLWTKRARSFEEMTNLPLALREKLQEKFIIRSMRIADKQVSADGTIKYAFKMSDGPVVEGVLIPTKNRTTACISSQVGCSLSCAFCATGKLKRLRNLEAYEIYDQVSEIYRDAEILREKPLSNIVYMGMGEPLLNYKNVLESTFRISDDKGLGMSPKRMTVSTAGIAKMIEKMGDDEVRFNLALSLHAANDEKRDKIMPINESNNLDALADALRYFHDKTGSRVTYEYIIFKDFNDTLEDARELAEFAKFVPCKINIIEYNPIDDAEFRQADPEKVDAFAEFLESRGLIVNVRRSRGKDIDAACGQLANKNKAALKIPS